MVGKLPRELSLPVHVNARFYRTDCHQRGSTKDNRCLPSHLLRQGASRFTTAPVGIHQKRENAAAFKGNEVPVLVATKAFGMSIDKPNIRYIVHYGMPDSLESFYQEAGRAGRDQQPAHCVVVFTEYDADRSDSLLDPNVDLDELERRFRAANRDRSIGDDVTSAMFFHLQTNSAGQRSEIQAVENVLREFNDLSSPQRHQLTYDGGDDKRRKEYAVVRLLRVGVLRDYEVEFGPKRLTVQTEPFNFERCSSEVPRLCPDSPTPQKRRV